VTATAHRHDGDRVARVGLGIAAVVVTAQVVAHLVDFWALDLRSVLLDSADEHSVFVRLGTVAILACAVATLMLGRRLLALACAWLFVDALLGIHEHIPHWTLIYIPVLAAVLAAYWLLSASFAPTARRIARSALVLLVVSAAIHRLGPHLLALFGWGPSAWEYQVKIALKEATEIGGWILLASGVYAANR
jgi:hypothetical protein